jgi:hypothetical protein
MNMVHKMDFQRGSEKNRGCELGIENTSKPRRRWGMDQVHLLLTLPPKLRVNYLPRVAIIPKITTTHKIAVFRFC